LSELDFDLIEDNDYAQEIRAVMKSENQQHNQIKDKLNSNSKDYHQDKNYNQIHHINDNESKRNNSNHI